MQEQAKPLLGWWDPIACMIAKGDVAALKRLMGSFDVNKLEPHPVCTLCVLEGMCY